MGAREKMHSWDLGAGVEAMKSLEGGMACTSLLDVSQRLAKPLNIIGAENHDSTLRLAADPPLWYLAIPQEMILYRDLQYRRRHWRYCCQRRSEALQHVKLE